MKKTQNLKRPPIFYQGKKYKSLATLSRELEINYQKLATLVRQGHSPDEAVEIINRKKYEYNGEYYASKAELAQKMGISPRVYLQSSKYKELRSQVSPCKKPFEFEGTIYSSKEEFYDFLGITGSGIRKYAVRHSISTQEALVYYTNKKKQEKNA